MAGHSKWNNIKHRKAAVDAKRSRKWSKCAKAIMVAARNGGSDPATNLALRYAIDEARYENMPRDTIERAVKKGAGELGGQDFESIRYEGYGAAGVAVVVDALTDNRTRTASEVRFIFSKFGGNLGQSGSVGFMFETLGQIVITDPADKADTLLETAIEANASDVAEPDDDESPWVISTQVNEFESVKQAIESAGIEIADASISLIPSNSVEVSGDDAKAVLNLIEALEENDDVQKVYANYDISAEELDQLSA